MGNVEVNWEALGMKPPETGTPPEKGGKEIPASARKPESESEEIREIDQGLSEIERRHDREVSFKPENAMFLEAMRMKERIKELEEERAERESSIEGGTMFASVEKMREFKDKRKREELGEFDRQIEDLGIEAALLESALEDLKSDDIAPADVHFAKQEAAAQASLESLEGQEKAARAELQKKLESGADPADLAKSADVLKALERQKMKSRGAVNLARDRRQHLKLTDRKRKASN